MQVEGRYTQVSAKGPRETTAHACLHVALIITNTGHGQLIYCEHCLKRWNAARTEHEHVSSSVLEEAHAFQRFEHVTLNRTGGRTSQELKIVCRCGWTSTSLQRTPNDDDVANTTAQEQLQTHINDAIARAKRPA